jgi:hypothetical protein
MTSAAAQPARKPIIDPLDKTPAWMKAQEVGSNEWRIWLNIDDEALRELGGDNMRMLAVLTAGAMRQGKRNSDYCDAEKTDRPANTLLVTIEMYKCPKCQRISAERKHCGKEGRWVNFAPCTAKNAGTLAGLIKQNASRALNALEDGGFIRRTGRPRRGHRRIWLCTKRTKPVPVADKSEAAAEIDAELTEQQIRVSRILESTRKRIAGAVFKQDFPIDPELVLDDRYYEAALKEMESYAAEAKRMRAQLKTKAEARIAALAEEFRAGVIKSDDPEGTDPEAPGIQSENPTESGGIESDSALYKERARGISSVSSKRAPEPSSSVQELGARLREHVNGNFDDDAADDLLKKCRNKCRKLQPPVTVDEIAACTERKARQTMKSGHVIRNPVGFLLEAVPKLIYAFVIEARSTS